MFGDKQPQTLQDLWFDELRDIYDAEQRLVEAIPKMAQAAGSPRLRTALQEHLSQTEMHASRIEELFDRFDVEDRSAKCEGIIGLIEEAEEALDEDMGPHVRDAAIIAAAQKVEHYEIATYGTLCAWANLLGKTDAAALLAETLNEEKRADERLTQLAEQRINEAAA